MTDGNARMFPFIVEINYTITIYFKLLFVSLAALRERWPTNTLIKQK